MKMRHNNGKEFCVFKFLPVLQIDLKTAETYSLRKIQNKKKIIKYDAEKKQSSTRKYIDPRNLDRGYRGTTLFV